MRVTGQLLPTVVWRALDSGGKPLSGAQLFTYLSGTTTPTPTYTSSSLGTPRTNPVVADSGGLFPEIFLDPTVTYRFDLKDASGTLIETVDPYTSAAPTPASNSITAAMLQAGVAASNLGFTPLNKAGDTPSGEIILGYTLGAPPNANSVGFRGMPTVTKNAAYTFSFDDSGRLFRHTDASAYVWTIPPNSSIAYPVGTIIGFRNFGAGVITMTRGSGVTLTISGSGTSKDVAIAQYGAGAIIKEDTDAWYIAGTGLS